MRTVNRALVPFPAVLANAAQIAAAVETYRGAGAKGKANGAIYAHDEVRQSLFLLYHNKCFLCEALTKKAGDQVVEHFLPHSWKAPERAYDWSNLNNACKRCNDLKRRKEFQKIAPNKDVLATLLLNPSSPPAASSIENIISFDHVEMEAIVSEEFQFDNLANNTRKLLNDDTLKHRRRNRADALRDTILQRCCLTDLKALCALDPLILDQFDPAKRAVMMNALDAADRLCLFFLRDSAEHCTSMRRLIEKCFSLHFQDLRRLGAAYSAMKDKPCDYA